MCENVNTLSETTLQAMKKKLLWPPIGNMNVILRQLGQRAHGRLMTSTQPGRRTTAHLAFVCTGTDLVFGRSEKTSTKKDK